MSNLFQASSVIEAIDLLRIRIENFSLSELAAHEAIVCNTILGLLDMILRTPHMSAFAVANVRSLDARLKARLSIVRGLIEVAKDDEGEHADSMREASPAIRKNLDGIP